MMTLINTEESFENWLLDGTKEVGKESQNVSVLPNNSKRPELHQKQNDQENQEEDSEKKDDKEEDDKNRKNKEQEESEVTTRRICDNEKGDDKK
jgi:hypothetical protein